MVFWCWEKLLVDSVAIYKRISGNVLGLRGWNHLRVKNFVTRMASFPINFLLVFYFNYFCAYIQTPPHPAFFLIQTPIFNPHSISPASSPLSPPPYPTNPTQFSLQSFSSPIPPTGTESAPVRNRFGSARMDFADRLCLGYGGERGKCDRKGKRGGEKIYLLGGLGSEGSLCGCFVE